MPIPPRPRTYKCPQCHWTRTYAPASDALFLPPWAHQCPKCGHEGMQRRPASLIDGVLARFLPFV